MNQTVLVTFVLVVLALLFWWVFIYTQRLEQTSFVGRLLMQTLYSAELQKRISEVEANWNSGQYQRDVINDETWFSAQKLPQRPSDAEPIADIAMDQLKRNGRLGGLPPGLAIGENTSNYLTELRNWAYTELDRKANSLRLEAIKRSEEEAKKESEKALGELDFSVVMGRGPEFILQFTAVVTIVFVVLALGIVGKLDSQQAGTILAAIAGYVLGQASSRREPRQKEVQTFSSSESTKPNAKG